MQLIVVESHFGNTVALAEALAATLRTNGVPTRVWMAHEATNELPNDVTRVLVACPTHEGTMSTAQTRKRAAGIGAKDSTDTQGVREWLEELGLEAEVEFVVFDTVRADHGDDRSAADAAIDLLRSRGLLGVERGPSFTVEGVAGPLSPGQLQLVRAWAKDTLAPAHG